MKVEATFTGFANRAEGGKRLAIALSHYRRERNTIVFGLPRGGVVTAAAIAEDLDLPLDVLVVRKLGVPRHSELAMGAIGPGGVRVLNNDVISALHINAEEIEAVARREQRELERRQTLFRGGRPPLEIRGNTIILVDDGLATGSTMAAAIAVVRHHHPARIVLAIPVAPFDICERFRPQVDELVCLETPEPFDAVGYWYVNFAQVEDEEVVRTLERFHARAAIEAR